MQTHKGPGQSRVTMIMIYIRRSLKERCSEPHKFPRFPGRTFPAAPLRPCPPLASARMPPDGWTSRMTAAKNTPGWSTAPRRAATARARSCSRTARAHAATSCRAPRRTWPRSASTTASRSRGAREAVADDRPSERRRAQVGGRRRHRSDPRRRCADECEGQRGGGDASRQQQAQRHRSSPQRAV